ncbi:hypothetical protein AB3N02_21915 [Priestia aryabhattai]|jgi:hypothetical protein|uniref:hypothetical protein n=1 Tax=Priestia aryabhattai TaxID=412384 RepID=UPI0039A2CFFB
MKGFLVLILVIIFIWLLGSCANIFGSSECDEDLMDYNMDGKVGVADYDIMKSAEQQCEDGY